MFFRCLCGWDDAREVGTEAREDWRSRRSREEKVVGDRRKEKTGRQEGRKEIFLSIVLHFSFAGPCRLSRNAELWAEAESAQGKSEARGQCEGERNVRFFR